ncbi:hypothetical protein CEXT_700511 [Caerostris extrusa]|uniref:Uncharacterized protein n=1 Tax=Caerostris extrusa TaxID=172846 RepID=A0AAV4RXB9_CAEEX|nr:hypothetical protein CEXT_700511 [Caerostris extrusa]
MSKPWSSPPQEISHKPFGPPTHPENLLPHKHYRKFTPHCSNPAWKIPPKQLSCREGGYYSITFPTTAAKEQSSLLLRHWKTIVARWPPELSRRIVSVPGGGQAVSACQTEH